MAVSIQHEHERLHAQLSDRRLIILNQKADLIIATLEAIEDQLDRIEKRQKTFPHIFDIKAMADSLWAKLLCLGALWALGISLKDALAFLKF